ncbi:hypothetical protein B0H10DRAFT_2230003 [Mycena sp. CBHHK59/15]|nr:hypothetical protein B0H10DRAFT_2230003 [Mycena sp. CBHHK59/15]
MHVVVEVVPLLLHTSLVFFFAGLVAFLLPVNQVMMIIAAVLLGLVVIYTCLTILPIISLDCPYRTPLSGAFWVVVRTLTTLMGRFTRTSSDGADRKDPPISPRTGSMMGAMTRRALHNSDERALRDRRALVWTLKSVTDDSELETFVESIPEALWGPSGRRRKRQPHTGPYR